VDAFAIRTGIKEQDVDAHRENVRSIGPESHPSSSNLLGFARQFLKAAIKSPFRIAQI
jgi:hypothetical protein